MKKILLLTKIHPVEIIDVMVHLYHDPNIANDKTLFFSPQYTALLAGEKTKAPFQNIFYPALGVWEREKENVLKEHPEFTTVVVVGTVDKKSRDWYDAIIGLDNTNLQDYKMDEDFNVNKIEYFTFEDAEVKFDSYQEVAYFIKHVEETYNAIQQTSTGSN